jgi:hypothetical protein
VLIHEKNDTKKSHDTTLYGIYLLHTVKVKKDFLEGLKKSIYFLEVKKRLSSRTQGIYLRHRV